MSDIFNNENQEVESVQSEEQLPDNLPDVKEKLFELPESPDKAQIEMWKQEHGEVFCSGFTATELFVFRSLTRGEFVQLQSHLAAQGQQVNTLDVEEQVVQQCLIWSSKDGLKALEKKAGSMSTLHEQIMQNSNFVNPAMAAALVMKL